MFGLALRRAEHRELTCRVPVERSLPLQGAGQVAEHRQTGERVTGERVDRVVIVAGVVGLVGLVGVGAFGHATMLRGLGAFASRAVLASLT